jgi:hypothetical protein
LKIPAISESESDAIDLSTHHPRFKETYSMAKCIPGFRGLKVAERELMSY